MAMQNMQFQQETRASIQRQESSIQNLTTNIGQMATSLNTLQSHNSDKFPSQTVLNPRNAPDWTPPFDLECDIAVYALGTVLAS
ncbi:hypothetical protein Lal_00039970 [Lupinus albus]|nr:hypothetical protein Lal_00039970 [Lupinus albus]